MSSHAVLDQVESVGLGRSRQPGVGSENAQPPVPPQFVDGVQCGLDPAGGATGNTPNGNGDLNVCPGGSVADANTDNEGRTTISGALSAGGWTDDGLRVYVSGTPVGQNLPIEVTSPDINADRQVNLSDVGLFATDFASGGYAFRSDFNFDQILNISDVGIFARHVGDQCP